MKLLVDLPQPTFERLEQLLRSGTVRSLNQAVLAAVESYLALVADAGLPPLTSGPLALDASANALTRPSSPAACAEPVRAESVPTDGLGVGRIGVVRTCPMPPVDAVSGRRYHLFSVNRLAPVKAGVRALAILLSGTSGAMPLAEFKEQASALVCGIGDHLVRHDNENELPRGEKLSSGFPRSGPKAKDSLGRYAYLVLGDVQKKSREVYGALYCLRLANIEPLDAGNGTVYITDPGLEFAGLSSPALDSAGAQPEEAFSTEEADWYVRHVTRNVPEEAQVLRRFLLYLSAGARRPQEIAQAMRPDYEHLSDNARANVRACVLGRLMDLRMVRRTEGGGYAVDPRSTDLLAVP